MPTDRKNSGVLRRMHRVRENASLIFWVLRDSLGHERLLATTAIATAMLSVALTAAAIGVMVGYAKLLESGEPVAVFGTAYAPRESGSLLAVACAGVLGLLLLAGALEYFRGLMTIAMHRRTHARRAEVVIGELSKPGLPVVPLGDAAPRALLGKIMGQDAAIFGRIARLLLNAIGPIVIGAIAFVALVVVEPLGTVVVAGAVVVALLFLYRTNRAAAASSRALEEARPRVQTAVRETLRLAAMGESVAAVDRSGIGELEVARGQRMRALAEGQLVANVAIGVALASVIATIGARNIKDGGGWTELIAVLVAIRYLMSNLRTISSTIVGVNRFHLNMERTKKWDRARENADEPVAHASCTAVVIGRGVPTERRHYDLTPGVDYLVLMPFDPDRLVASAALRAVVVGTNDQWMGLLRTAVVTGEGSELNVQIIGTADTKPIVFRVASLAATTRDTEASMFFVVKDGRLVAMGSRTWWTEHREAITAAVLPPSPNDGSVDDGEDDLDD